MKDAIKVKEPSIIIKPIGKLGGLDNLHVTLIVVIALLFLLLLVVSYSKPIILSNATNATHNQTQIKALVQRVLASYANVNSSLSLVPFISNVTSLNATYLPASGFWYAWLKANNFQSRVTLTLAFLISDLNTSKITPLFQTALPARISNNSVVAQGVVSLAGKYSCITTSPTQVYWFIDPYASGAIRSLANATNAQSRSGSNVNLTFKIVQGTDTQAVAASYGASNALALSKYVYCASQQANFSTFAANLNAFFGGSYVSGATLSSIVNYSHLSSAQLNKCVNASSQALTAQTALANYYSITQTPVAVVNCHYLALPQTVQQALCFVNKQLC